MDQKQGLTSPAKPAPKKKQRSKRFKIIVSVISILAIAYIILIIAGLPSIEELENPKTNLASEVFDINGQPIGTFSKEARIEIKYGDLPPHLINALIATEDRAFYKHWGVDIPRIFKAGINFLLTFKKSGASTITQQLAKNLYNFKAEKENIFEAFTRKIREWITAIQIEHTYTKKEIITMYFNISPYPRSAFGIEMASRTFFKKSAKYLSINESALLVAILKGNSYDPSYNPDKAFRRRNLVLHNMVDAGFLSESDYERLKTEPIMDFRDSRAQGYSSTIAPYFLDFIQNKAKAIAEKHGYDLQTDGLKIYTTIDARMQVSANEAIKAHLEKFQIDFDKYWKWEKNKETLNDLVEKAIKKRIDYLHATEDQRSAIFAREKMDNKFIDSVKKVAQQIEVGFVAIDPATGQIRAMVGGRESKSMRVWNHAVHPRQTGSSFKPFTYLTAIKKGLYPAYPIMDEEFVYEDGWNPKNFTGTCTHKFMTLRDAMNESINTVTSRIIVEGHVTPQEVGETANQLGIRSKLDLFPSIALGTSIVTPLELVSAYSTIANKGTYNQPIAILKITDKNGVLIESFNTQKKEGVSEEDAYMITSMLESALNNGTGASSRHYFKFPAAGKTGTTQNYRDAWYVGFTPHLAAGVWVGFDDERISYNSKNGQGAVAALPIWAKFMADTYTKCHIPQDDFIPPASGDIVYASLCRTSVLDLGDPKLVSDFCNTEPIVDIINRRRTKLEPYDPRIHNKVKIFTRFSKADTLAHEAQEVK